MTVSDILSLALVVVAYLTGRFTPNRRAAAGAAGVLVLLAMMIAASGDSAVPLLITVPPAWIVGRVLRERRGTNVRLAARADELEAERDAYAQLSVRYERARIAAELHDIVAHAVTVMVVQAAAGQRLAGVDPELTVDTFDAIAGSAREAHQDLERLVDLLADREPIGAAPDLQLIQDLVERAAGTGLDVRLELAGDREGLPAEVAHVAYRVVQEGLTNSLRYATGAPVRIVVRGTPADLAVEVLSGVATRAATQPDAGTGNGLRGLRERLSALGGALDAGPTPDGGWVLNARLPRRAAVAVLGTAPER